MRQGFSTEVFPVGWIEKHQVKRIDLAWRQLPRIALDQLGYVIDAQFGNVLTYEFLGRATVINERDALRAPGKGLQPQGARACKQIQNPSARNDIVMR